MTAANRERHEYVWLDDIRPATLNPKRFLGTSQTAAEHAKHCQTIIDTTARTATSARHSSRWPDRAAASASPRMPCPACFVPEGR